MASSSMPGGCTEYDNDIIERQTAERLESEHQRDNLVMLAYVILLILSVLTVWALKQRRFKYLHSSGLAIIYGLIAGAIFRYGITAESFSSATYNLKPPSPNMSCHALLPPQKMVLLINSSLVDPKQQNSKSLLYLYSFDRSTTSPVVADDTAHFNPEIFFNIILPPIIFTAGYSMKKRHFFRNIGAICTYAFFGTVIAAFGIASICFGFTRIIPSIADQLSFVDCVLFGSMISATDPVTVLAIFNELHVDFDLYALVFGESILNDAVAIALTHAVEGFGKLGPLGFAAVLPTVGAFMKMFLGSLAIGVFTGLITALLTKYTHIRNFPTLETALFVLMSYSTFLLAEGIGYTGIVSVLFCGIIQAHYTYNNLSKISKTWTKEFFELLNFLAENFIFAFLGVATFTFRDHYWRVDFIIIALLACFIARAVQVYLLSMFVNGVRHVQAYGCRPAPPHPHTQATVETASPECSQQEQFGYHKWDTPDQKAMRLPVGGSAADVQVDFTECNVKIPLTHQHMLLFAGLRGAMAFSLAARNASTYMRQMFFSTTIVIVMVSVLICGTFVAPLMQWLKIRVGMMGLSDDESESDPAVLATKIKQKERHYRERTGCWRLWTSFDSRFLKPLLTNSVPTLVETLPACCNSLARFLTTEEQRRMAEGFMHQDFAETVPITAEPDGEQLFLASEEGLVTSTTTAGSSLQQIGNR